MEGRGKGGGTGVGQECMEVRGKGGGTGVHGG